MKRILALLLILLLIPVGVSSKMPNAEEQELKKKLESGLDDQINILDTREWDRLMKELKNQGNPMVKETDVKKVIRDLVTGNFNFDLKGILSVMGDSFFRELKGNMAWMIQVLVLAVICGVLNHLQGSFENSSVASIAYFVCYLVVMVLVIHSLTSILDVGKKAIEQMVFFMQIIIPVLLALLIAMGGLASSAVLQPTIAILVETVGTFLKNTMIPLILTAAILVLVNHINDKIQLNRLSGLIENLCKWTLGIVFTIFIGVLTIQGAMAASVDGISVRTAKYAIDTFVPIVGGLFSKALDTIISCSLLVKNATGVAGLLVIAIICIHPLMKILSLLTMYKLSGALLEPISDPKIVDCLNRIGNVITILFVTVAGVAILFFLTIALMIGAGNITVMMR